MKLSLLLLILTLAAANRCAALEPLQVEPAKMADAFVDSIGVNVHLSYFDTSYSNFQGIVKARLLEAGIRHIRDGCPSLGQTEFLARLNELGTNGVHAMLLCSPHTGKTSAEIIEAIKKASTAAELIEGPNETDGAGISYKGLGFPEGTHAFQDDLFAAVKADPQLKKLPVVMSSISDPEKAPRLGLLPSADFANTHSYAGGTPPGFRWNWYVDRCQANCHQPIIASETGYHNAINQTDELWIRGVSEQASGRYIPRVYAEYFRRGVVRTYVYEFLDERQKLDYSEANFGMLRWNGEPKPSFTAVKNLIALLADSGVPFDPGTLEYAVNPDDQPVRHLLLRKRDGRFYLLLWINAESYDLKGKHDLHFDPRPTRLVFAKPIASAKACLPLQGLTPVAIFGRCTEFTIPVPDHILVVELTM